jgi:hypothetical protein
MVIVLREREANSGESSLPFSQTSIYSTLLPSSFSPSSLVMDQYDEVSFFPTLIISEPRAHVSFDRSSLETTSQVHALLLLSPIA